MQRLQNPDPQWRDLKGELLDAGYIYIGEANKDPEIDPLTVYWETDRSQVADQPLRTRGGVIINEAVPAFVWIPEDDYSIRVLDADGNLVRYVASVAETGSAAASYQPLDADLTTIAGQSNTSYGMSLLTVSNAAALRTLAGVVEGLPTTGGTVTANIVRSGAGPHLYHADATYVSGKVIVTAAGAADPTTAVGDIWLELEP